LKEQVGEDILGSCKFTHKSHRGNGLPRSDLPLLARLKALADDRLRVADDMVEQSKVLGEKPLPNTPTKRRAVFELVASILDSLAACDRVASLRLGHTISRALKSRLSATSLHHPTQACQSRHRPYVGKSNDA
jgi:hypothetical protein